MAAEEPQQQKQEPLGSDSEGTDPGRATRPGLTGAMPGRRFPRRLGTGPPAAGGETHGRPFLPLPPPPLPLTMEGAAAATLGRPGRRSSERAGRGQARGSFPPRAPGAGPEPPRPPAQPLRAGRPAPGYQPSGPSPCSRAGACRPGPGSPPSPEQPAPGRASSYAGPRSTKDGRASRDAAGGRGLRAAAVRAPEDCSLRFR